MPESWEEGRPETEEERLKYREIEDHREVGEKASRQEQMAERGWMGVREEVKSRQAQLESRGEEKGRGRKKLGKQMN